MVNEAEHKFELWVGINWNQLICGWALIGNEGGNQVELWVSINPYCDLAPMEIVDGLSLEMRVGNNWNCV